MKLSNDELYEEFYSTLPEEFQGIPFEEIKVIVSSQYKMLKDEMENGKFEPVRLKYLGVFQVMPNRAKFMLTNLEKKFKKQLETYIKKQDECRRTS